MKMVAMWHILFCIELKIFQKKFKKFIGTKNTTTNIYRIKAYNSIRYGYFRLGFIDFMLKGKSVLDCTNLFSAS